MEMITPIDEANFDLDNTISEEEYIDWDSIYRSDYVTKGTEREIEEKVLRLKAEQAYNKNNNNRSTSTLSDKPTADMMVAADSLLEDIEEPFYNYIESDKSGYKRANEVINKKTGKPWVDKYGYILIDDNEAFLLNIDFKFTNIDLFRQSAIHYKKVGKYTPHRINSIAYRKFRLREEKRRKYGLTKPCRLNKDGKIVDLHITGELYNFLNYGRVKVLDKETTANTNIRTKKKFDFPDFIDAQFWYTTMKEFARNNGFNNITLKARRKGASFMESIDSANVLNSTPHEIVIHAAGEKKFLTKAGAITNMSYRQLTFYERHTPFIRGGIDKHGIPKGLLSDNLDELQLGYKLKNNEKTGWLSTLFTVSTKDNPGAAVGKDATEIKCDELNDFPNFSDFMAVTNPTTTTGAYKTGMISAFGTGGAKEGNWLEFEKNYFETALYGFMPLANVWDKDSINEKIGFFIPFWWGLQGASMEGVPAYDHNGNSNYKVAIEISRAERAEKKLKSGIGRDYIMFCSQFANRPSEAFNSGTETILTSLELKEHINNVKLDSSYHYYKDGRLIRINGVLEFKTNEWLDAEGYEIHPYVYKVPFNSNEDFRGCLRIFNRPFYDETGKIPKDLYFVTYDPVGAEIIKGEIKDRHSLAHIQVWMAANNFTGNEGKVPVASWIGRRDTHKEMDNISLDILEFYGCKILPEMDRGNVKANYAAAGKTHLILPDPLESIVSRQIVASSQRSLGMIIGKGSRKVDGVDYIKDWLYENVSVDMQGNPLKRFHFIADLSLLQEFDKFRFNGNFDRVSTTILAMFQLNLQTAKKSTPKESKHTKDSTLSDLFLS